MRKPVKRLPGKQSTELIRLNKYIASAGLCSRRDADELITKGKVKVNGKVVTDLGTKIPSTAKVSVNDKNVQGERKVYVVMNKPKDVITTTRDPEGRKTVTDLIGSAIQERLFPIGRLDRNTTGILILTNDGEMAERLTHPRYGIEKIYEVILNKSLSDADMEKLAAGIELEDGLFKLDHISFPDEGNRTILGVKIHSGRNRIIRRSFEHLGYDVVKLDRVTFAGLTKKNLPRGRWRRLTPKEISFLKMKGKK